MEQNGQNDQNDTQTAPTGGTDRAATPPDGPPPLVKHAALGWAGTEWSQINLGFTPEYVARLKEHSGQHAARPAGALKAAKEAFFSSGGGQKLRELQARHANAVRSHEEAKSAAAAAHAEWQAAVESGPDPAPSKTAKRSADTRAAEAAEAVDVLKVAIDREHTACQVELVKHLAGVAPGLNAERQAAADRLAVARDRFREQLAAAVQEYLPIQVEHEVLAAGTEPQSVVEAITQMVGAEFGLQVERGHGDWNHGKDRNRMLRATEAALAATLPAAARCPRPQIPGGPEPATAQPEPQPPAAGIVPESAPQPPAPSPDFTEADREGRRQARVKDGSVPSRNPWGL